MDVKTFYETRFEVSDSYPLLVRIGRLPLARLCIYSYLCVGELGCKKLPIRPSLETLLGISICGELSIFQFPLVVFPFPYTPPHTPSFAEGDAQPAQNLRVRLDEIYFLICQGSRPNCNIFQFKLTTYLPQRRPWFSPRKKIDAGS